MRIVLDLQACQGSSAQRGIGRYSMALAQAMLRQAGGHDCRIVLNNHFPDSIAPLRAAFDTLLPQEHITVYDLPAQIWEHSAQNSWRLRAAEQLREHYMASLAPDVVHMSSLFEGLGENACCSALHSGGRFDTAVTLYDLIPLMRKETYLTDPHVANWYYRKLQSLKNAELLLAISNHTRQEAMGALQLPGERVVNISSAVDAIFRPRTLAPQDAAALRARLGLQRPFFMYTGGIDYRKNIEGLIEAYAMLPAALRQQYQLAVVCSIHEADRVRLLDLAARLRLAEGDLVLTGFISDDDLVSLYNLTDLFVFPSLQEGFGLPALEAMACGAPVIGSNNSSIPEVIGRADALFDPTRPTEIAARLHQGVTDAGFSASLRAHGLQQAKLFSWEASAHKALAAFEQVHQQRGQGRAAAVNVGALPARRPRLAYISPLPPERSGIADYSAELLPELARYYEIDVVLLHPVVSDRWIGANFAQRSLEWFEDNSARFDRILYHFGNSAFHAHMFGLLARHPGVVVLHDFFLSGAVNYLCSGSSDPHAYCKELYAAHGYGALLHELQQGREASYYQYPCNKAVLDHAKGVIVHSAHSKQLATHWYGPRQGANWKLIPHLRVMPDAQDRSGARASLGFKDGDFLMCSFGLIGRTKRNEQILEAWLQSPLAQDERCHLVFVGANDAHQFGAALAARIDASRRVRITGFAAPELYRSYLNAADAAVQLRTSSRGETSGTVLDCLAYRLPTIINAHGSAAELPAPVALRLADDFSLPELVAAMTRLYQDAGLARQLAERGAAYIAEVHHPARIGGLYRDAIEAIAQDSPRGRYGALLAALDAIDTTCAPAEPDWLQAAACIAANDPGSSGRQLLIDVSELALKPGQAPCGLVRDLIRYLIETPPAGYRVEPVIRAEGRYRYARRLTLEVIGRADLAFDDMAADIKPCDHVLRLTPDAALAPELALSNRGTGQTALLLAPLAAHDALPAHLPAATKNVLRLLEGWADRLTCLHAGGSAVPAWLAAAPAVPGPAARQAVRRARGMADPDFLLCVLGAPAEGSLNARLRQAWAQSPLAGDPHCHLVFVQAERDVLAGADLALLLESDAAACAALLACLGHAVPLIFNDVGAGLR